MISLFDVLILLSQKTLNVIKFTINRSNDIDRTFRKYVFKIHPYVQPLGIMDLKLNGENYKW